MAAKNTTNLLSARFDANSAGLTLCHLDDSNAHHYSVAGRGLRIVDMSFPEASLGFNGGTA